MRSTSPLALTLLAILSVLPAPGLRAGTRMDRESTERVKISGESRIYVKNGRGSTTIVGKKGARFVSLEVVKKVQAPDPIRARELMEHLEYRIKRREGTIAIVVHHPRSSRRGWLSFLSRLRERARIDLHLEVPARFAANVSTASGEVEISRLQGRVKVTSASGDVTLLRVGGDVAIEVSSGEVVGRNLGGDVAVHASSGSVEMSDVAGSVRISGASGDVILRGVGGDVDATLGSGDLELEGCGGSLRVVTSSGDIEVVGAKGKISLSSSSGDIRLVLSPHPGGEYRVSTASGDVLVDLLKGPRYGFELEARTESGSITGELTLQTERAQITRQRLKGRVGRGGPHLVVDTASGDIVLKEREGH